MTLARSHGMRLYPAHLAVALAGRLSTCPLFFTAKRLHSAAHKLLRSSAPRGSVPIVARYAEGVSQRDTVGAARSETGTLAPVCPPRAAHCRPGPRKRGRGCFRSRSRRPPVQRGIFGSTNMFSGTCTHGWRREARLTPGCDRGAALRLKTTVRVARIGHEM